MKNMRKRKGVNQAVKSRMKFISKILVWMLIITLCMGNAMPVLAAEPPVSNSTSELSDETLGTEDAPDTPEITEMPETTDTPSATDTPGELDKSEETGALSSSDTPKETDSSEETEGSGFTDSAGAADAEEIKENVSDQVVSEAEEKIGDTVTIDFNDNAKDKFVVITPEGYSIGDMYVKVNDKNWVSFTGKYIITGYRQHTVHRDGLDVVYVKGGTAEAPVDITLKDLTIDLTNIGTYTDAEGLSAIGIGSPSQTNADENYWGSQANVKLTLEGENVIKGGPASAAVGLGRYASLTIDGAGTLTAVGGDSRKGSGGWAAPAIGDDVQSDAKNYQGNITINGGNIFAYGGSQDGADGKPNPDLYRSHMGVAIGGGAGTVTINGGYIEATGGSQGAGIGTTQWQGNDGDNYSKVEIRNATVVAKGGYGAPGIGASGNDNDKNGYSNHIDILIEDANVTATGGIYGASIGTGNNDKAVADNIIIKNSTINASAPSGACIGNGISSISKNIEIENCNLDLAGGQWSAAIGGGWKSSAGSISIKDSSIKAQGGLYGSAIGSGSKGTSDSVNIANSEIIAIGGVYGAGIGNGFESVNPPTLSVDAASDVSAYAMGYYQLDDGAGNVEERSVSAIEVDEANSAVELSALQGRFKTPIAQDGDKEFTIVHKDGTTVMTMPQEYNSFGRIMEEQENANIFVDGVIHAGSLIEYKEDALFKNFDVNEEFKYYWLIQPVQIITVTFETNGGTPVPDKQEISVGEVAVEPDQPKKEGHTFIGWYEDAECTTIWDFNTTIDVDKILYAKWKENIYSVKYDTGFEDINIADKENVKWDDENLLPETPQKEGYDFIRWELDGKEVLASDKYSSLTTDQTDGTFITLKAVWEAHKYTVIFDKNSAEALGTMENQEFLFEEEKSLNGNQFTRENYTFAGWAAEPEGEIVYTDMQAVKNLTSEKDGMVYLYAVWNEIGDVNYIIEHYKQNKDGTWPQKASDAEEKTAKPGTKVNGEAKTYEGYVFDSSVKDSILSGVVKKDGSLVLKLYYRMRHTVIFDSDGGDYTPGDQNVNHGDQAAKPKDPVKEGYVFDGWYYTDEDGKEHLWNFGDEVTGDMKLTAHWKDAKKPMKPSKPSKPSVGGGNSSTNTTHTSTNTTNTNAKTTTARSVKTGDTTNLILLFSLLAGSAVAGAAILIGRKRKKDK